MSPIKIVNLIELDKCAFSFCRILTLPCFVLLSGSLGAGKTAFVQACCKHMNIREHVKSPSFNLLNIYHGIHQKQKTIIYHVDLYRLSSTDNPEEKELWQPEVEDNFIYFVEWFKISQNQWDILAKAWTADILQVDITAHHLTQEREITWQSLKYA